MPPASTASRPQLSTAFFGFVLIGIASGAWGVLLPSVSAYHKVSPSVVGLLFIASAIAFFLIGTSLGPIYPSTVALLPNIVPSRLLSSAMGFLIGLSVLGIALFPWLAGTLAHYIGIWSLLPYTVGLTGVMLVLWWTIRIRSLVSRECNSDRRLDCPHFG